VSDNGVGFPKDLDFRNTDSLGMQLVTTLAEQIDGTIALRNGVGTTFEITFPEARTPML
jgi:two-component sensor histidine kinase